MLGRQSIAMVGKHLCYPNTRVLIFLPSRIPRNRVGFQVLFAVSPKILTNRTPAPESDTDTRTRVHVTLLESKITPLKSCTLV